jgi:hypothetical protein
MAVEGENRKHREPALGRCLFCAPHTFRIVIGESRSSEVRLCKMSTKFWERRKNGLEQVRREEEAVRLAVQLVNESEGSTTNIAFRESDLETHDNEVCGATVSMRLSVSRGRC